MSELEFVTILKEIKQIKDQLSILTRDKGMMKLQEASKFLSISPARLRKLCKEGLNGTTIINKGSKNLHYLIDVQKAKEDLENTYLCIGKGN